MDYTAVGILIAAFTFVVGVLIPNLILLVIYSNRFIKRETFNIINDFLIYFPFLDKNGGGSEWGFVMVKTSAFSLATILFWPIVLLLHIYLCLLYGLRFYNDYKKTIKED